MIHFYTDKKYINDATLELDTEAIFYFFTQERDKVYFDDDISNEILRNVEGVDYRSGNIVRNSISETHIQNISTGCKAVLIAVSHPDTCITNLEMGDNAVIELYRHKDREIHIMCYNLLPYSSDCSGQVMLNNQKCDFEEAIEEINDDIINNRR